MLGGGPIGFTGSAEARRTLVGVAALGVCALFAPGAAAAPTPADLEAARQSFVRAEADEDDGHWEAALEELERISQIKLTAGIRYHMALCQEHLGRLTAARTGYAQAQAQARVDGAEDVLRLVGARAADLDARVPRLTIHIVPELRGERVRLDGKPLDPSQVGVAIPIDPGLHQVEAVAPGRAPSTATVATREREATVLEMDLGAAAPAGSRRSPRDQGADTRAEAIVTSVTALVLLGGGVGAFFLSSNAKSEAQARCRNGACDVDAARTTIRAWDWTAMGAWAGAAVAGAVAIVFWTSPGHPSSTGGASAKLVGGPASLSIEGSF